MPGKRPLKKCRFHIELNYEARACIEIVALDSHHAVSKLPQCTSWDFMMYPSGQYQAYLLKEVN